MQLTVEDAVPTRVIAGVPQLSKAMISDAEGEGVKLQGKVSGEGHEITGGSKSEIVLITCRHVDEFPHASVAFHS